jgi:uncharacterized protein
MAFVAALVYALAVRRAILGCAFLISACEHRLDEPAPPRPTPIASIQPDRPVGSTHGTTASGAPAPSGPLAGRCIKPTPAEPPPPVAEGPDPACPDDPDGRLKLRYGRVEFVEATTSVEVEIAESEKARLRGLMYRKSLGEEQGMIFVFDDREVSSFWMKNTCLPLDMLFIDHDGVIVGISENVPTLNKNSYGVGCPSLYVLEVNAGWSRRHGVTAGQRVKLEL